MSENRKYNLLLFCAKWRALRNGRCAQVHGLGELVAQVFAQRVQRLHPDTWLLALLALPAVMTLVVEHHDAFGPAGPSSLDHI